MCKQNTGRLSSSTFLRWSFHSCLCGLQPTCAGMYHQCHSCAARHSQRAAMKGLPFLHIPSPPTPVTSSAPSWPWEHGWPLPPCQHPGIMWPVTRAHNASGGARQLVARGMSRRQDVRGWICGATWWDSVRLKHYQVQGLVEFLRKQLVELRGHWC